MQLLTNIDDILAKTQLTFFFFFYKFIYHIKLSFLMITLYFTVSVFLFDEM